MSSMETNPFQSNGLSVKPVKNKGKPASLSMMQNLQKELKNKPPSGPNNLSKGKPASRASKPSQSSMSNKPSSMPSTTTNKPSVIVNKPSSMANKTSTMVNKPTANPLPLTSKPSKPAPTMANLLKLSSIKTELVEKIDAAKKLNVDVEASVKNTDTLVVSKVLVQSNKPGPKSRQRPTNSTQNSNNPNQDQVSKSGNNSVSAEKINKPAQEDKMDDSDELDFEQELDNMLKSAEMIFNKPLENDFLNKQKATSQDEEKMLDESNVSENVDSSFEEVEKEIKNFPANNKKEDIVNKSKATTNQYPDDEDIIFIDFENTPAQKERDSEIENQVMMNNNQLIALQVELLKKDEEIDANADQIDILTVKNQDLSEDLEKSKHKNEELNEDIADIQKKFERSKTAKEDLFKNNKKNEATISELKNTLSSKDEELKKKKRELSEKSSLNSEFYKRLLDLTKLNTEFNAKTKQTEATFKKKEEELKNKEVSEKMLQKEIKKLIPQVTELEKTIFEKSQEIEDLDEKLKSLENVLQEKNALLSTKEDSDKIMQTEIEELKKDQEEKNKVNSELYKQLLHLTKQNTDSSARIKQLEDDLQKSENILKTRESSENSLKKEVEDLSKQVVDLKSIADEKNKLHSLAESKLDMAETSLKENESELEKKESEIKSLKADNLNLKTTADEKIELHDSVVSKLKRVDLLMKGKDSSLQQKESEVNILQVENLELKVKVSHLNAKKKDQSKANEELSSKLLQQKENLEELQKEIEGLKTNAEGKNKLNMKLSTKARKLEDLLGEKEEIINKKVAAEGILFTEIRTLKTLLEDLRNGTDSKEKLIEEFTSKIKSFEDMLKQDDSNNSLKQNEHKRKSAELLENPQKRMNFECDTMINEIINDVAEKDQTTIIVKEKLTLAAISKEKLDKNIVDMVLQELIDDFLYSMTK